MVGNKIKIEQGKNADSRTAVDKSKRALLVDTLKHIQNVNECMNLLAYLIMQVGSKHDFTKLTEFDKFYNDYKYKSGEDFTSGEWYNIHITEERHHIARHEKDDVNLIDVLEHVVDIVVAGKSRSGEVNKEYDDVTNEMLRKAYDNTIDLIDNLTELNKEEY